MKRDCKSDPALNDGFTPSIIIKDIALDLRKRFRKITIDKGVSMNQLLKDLILEYVEKEELHY